MVIQLVFITTKQPLAGASSIRISSFETTNKSSVDVMEFTVKYNDLATSVKLIVIIVFYWSDV